MAQAAAIAGLENIHGIIGKFKLEGISAGLKSNLLLSFIGQEGHPCR